MAWCHWHRFGLTPKGVGVVLTTWPLRWGSATHIILSVDAQRFHANRKGHTVKIRAVDEKLLIEDHRAKLAELGQLDARRQRLLIEVSMLESLIASAKELTVVEAKAKGNPQGHVKRVALEIVDQEHGIELTEAIKRLAVAAPTSPESARETYRRLTDPKRKEKVLRLDGTRLYPYNEESEPDQPVLRVMGNE